LLDSFRCVLVKINRNIWFEGIGLTEEENLISAYIAIEKIEAVNTTKVFRRKTIAF
jgi:hypothetical protein